MSFDPYQTPQPPNYAPQPPSSNLAVFSLVLGVCSLLAVFPSFCCCLPIVVVVPPAVIAIALGVVALVQINRGNATGQGFAIVGISFGILALLIVAAFFALFAFANFAPDGEFEFDGFDFDEVFENQ